MEQYEVELAEAEKRLVANGRDRNDFSFQMSYLPPDPDGAGMFTLLYEVTITNNTTSKSLVAIGGIGWDWVGTFEEELRDGYFD